MGSRRRTGAAPVVVGGADPIAAEVTTTAGLGDGVHDFCAVSFLYTEFSYECGACCCRDRGTRCIANVDRGAASLDYAGKHRCQLVITLSFMAGFGECRLSSSESVVLLM